MFDVLLPPKLQRREMGYCYEVCLAYCGCGMMFAYINLKILYKSLLSECLWYDKLSGPFQREVTLFYAWNVWDQLKCADKN